MIVALMPAAATAQQTRSAVPGAAPPAASIERFAWLEGTWRGPALGGDATEVYSAPTAGGIAGHFIQVNDGKVHFYELTQIVPRGTSLVYRLRHFNADLTGWEDARKGAAIEFPLVAIEDDAFYFDGMTFRRNGPNAMTVWVRIDDGGKTREIAFPYRRAAR